MKGMIVDAKAFSEAMNKVSRVLKKSAIPILEEIRVSVKDGVCTLTATDLETWLTARLPVKGDDMSFTFFKTKDVMKACSHFDGELTIELYEQPEKRKDARRLRLYCGQRAAEYDATSDEDYPSLVSVASDKVFQTNAAACTLCHHEAGCEYEALQHLRAVQWPAGLFSGWIPHGLRHPGGSDLSCAVSGLWKLSCLSEGLWKE